MHRQSIVAANWKMNGNLAFVNDMCAALSAAKLAVQAVVFSPNIYLPHVSDCLRDSNIAYGAQNVSQFAKGAYTGEISLAMLNDFACRYVLVGHSERRQLFAESNEVVAEKFMAVKQAGIIPILCIGETQAQREAGQTEAVIDQQLDVVLNAGGIADFANAVIAYEPVWAIGTGLTATPEQAQAVHAFIRNKLHNLNADVAASIPLLYGGSVKPGNAAELFAMEDIDGGLVGGASLVAKDFIEICRQAED